MIPDVLVVAARFNGPPGSGNGGYVAGRLAAYLPGDRPVQVTLREPPPLDVPLDVLLDTDRAQASFGGAIVVAAEPGVHRVDPVAPVPFDVAADAERRYPGLAAHPFPGCFACGTERPDGDGLRLRPGRVGGDPAGPVATTWVPDGSLRGPDGTVAAPFVWAALDCPGGWAADIVARPMVLGRMTAAVHARPEGGDRCVVLGQVVGGEGRKTYTVSTAYDADGRVLGHAESTWIALR